MPITPAEQLEGKTLPGGWEVVRRLERDPRSTGGNFSVGYVVRSKQGEQGYLKALDYTMALQAPDPATALQALTTAFVYERRLCESCREKSMSKVVRILDHGKVLSDPALAASVVQYLVFELAEGDVRERLDAMDRFDLAWAMRALHNVATGLEQLHGGQIAHQDLKPSNILQFPDDVSKVGDLGRSTTRGDVSPYDELQIAGDTAYAPPELLYGHVDPDWARRRLGCDIYLFGSMIVFLFCKSPMTPLVVAHMNPQHHWRIWDGPYEEVLPYVRDAFGSAVALFLKDVPAHLRGELGQSVRQLCEPDPRLRGHPRERIGHQNPYTLRRYISSFASLATEAEYGLTRGTI